MMQTDWTRRKFLNTGFMSSLGLLSMTGNVEKFAESKAELGI